MARILVIDTSAKYGAYISAHLKSAGHDCLLDTRGDRALDMVKQHKVDLVIAEVMLPDVCGFEICRRIRADESVFTLPVVLMSSMSAEHEVQHGLAQGADDYLAKPMQPAQLTMRINQALQNAREMKAPDPITGLPGQEMIKAIIRQAITQKRGFAAAYVELDNIVNFGREAGMAARDEALCHLAHLLKQYGKQLDTPLFHAAHIGVGHFMCVMPPDQVVPYCKAISTAWETSVADFYGQLGLKAQAGSGSSQAPPLNLVLCATDIATSGARSVNTFFDVLAQLRRKALSGGSAGLYMDKRRAPSKKRRAS